MQMKQKKKNEAKKTKLSMILGSHSGVDENASLLEYEAVTIDSYGRFRVYAFGDF
jgi:hypothetical protein